VSHEAGETLLEAKGLHKRFNALVVLDGVDFSSAPTKRSASSAPTGPARRRC